MASANHRSDFVALQPYKYPLKISLFVNENSNKLASVKGDSQPICWLNSWWIIRDGLNVSSLVGLALGVK